MIRVATRVFLSTRHAECSDIKGCTIYKRLQIHFMHSIDTLCGWQEAVRQIPASRDDGSTHLVSNCSMRSSTCLRCS